MPNIFLHTDHPIYSVPSYPEIKLYKPTNQLSVLINKCFNTLTASVEKQEIYQLHNLQNPLSDLKVMLILAEVPSRIIGDLLINILPQKQPNDYTEQDFAMLYSVGAKVYQQFYSAEWFEVYRFGMDLYVRDVQEN